MTLRERFEEKYIPEPNSGCWLWSGAMSMNGYGVIGRGRGCRAAGAHRVSWELHRGPIPEGIFVCHKCDIPSCVNPDHLFLGTPSENTADMFKKGRWKSPTPTNRLCGDEWRKAHMDSLPVGEDHHCAKFTEDQVRYIRKSHLNGCELADKFNVAPITISKIRRRLTWGHVQ